ncbi:MAG: adenosylcobinamide-GDP ribazoletransferase [Thermaerobacter sp.]|jgi:adenosylcobinamide-GDP ribazoletransferase|nr:adenosylcobinamide-GDP ribazoletransferase [Thermaerobacter sp.]
MAVCTRLTQRFWLAFGLLTRLPLPRVAAADPAGSAAFFPWVGLVVGALGAAAWYLLYRPLGAWLAGAAVLVVGVLVTGGLHQDGFLDTADGLASGRPAAAALRIMRDSRAGGLGVVYLGLLLLLKFSLLSGTAFPDGWRDLVLFPAAGRAAMALAAWRAVYPREQGLGGTVVGRVRPGELAAAVSFLAAAAWLLAGWRGEVAALAALAVAGAGRWWLTRRLGGLTGDTLGAVNEVAEVAALMALVWRGGAP